MRLVSVLALITALASSSFAADSVDRLHSFDSEDALNAIETAVSGEAEKRKGGPKLQGGKLSLLESWWKSEAAIALAPLDEKRYAKLSASWKLVLNTGTEGTGFLLLDVDTHGKAGLSAVPEKWEEPSLARAFGVGFDASNPPNRDPFRGSGNTYDRPQHEVSLHWDGMEIVKKTTPHDFRDEEPHAVRVAIDFVVGGALVSVQIDDDAIYDHYFIAEMTAFKARAAFGARNTETAGDILLDDIALSAAQEVEAPEAPTSIVALDRVLNDKSHPKNSSEIAFPEDSSEYARIILTLRLDKPETRFDPWDRLAAISVYDEAGEKYELVRYITPYHKGHVWKVDVTHFRSLLTGTRKIEQECGTQGEGWVVSVQLDFYPGKVDRLAYRVERLWSGKAVIGDPDKPVAEFYQTRVLEVDPQARYAEVRSVVTGHGMSPNTNNAAEFMPLGRTLEVNGEEFKNLLWKTDNYLNPCRPQGGTWKYDRAGWAPGDVVRPWVVDVSHLLGAAISGEGQSLRVGYKLDPYINEGRGKTWSPFHNTEAYVVFYRRAAPQGSQKPRQRF